MSALLEIEVLLKQTIGLDAASVGLSLIERAVQQRTAACGLTDAFSYLEKVRASATELQELIEAVVVSETWFFRDREAFAAMGRIVLDEWLPLEPGTKLRLLSIPCATGEEPYSMAMALDGLGLPADCFQIDAVDISEQALMRARKAVYGRNSFRGKDLEFRDRYFEPRPPAYHLVDTIRRRVLFQQANLLHPDFFPGSHLFHFIFCRNLLIYLDQAAQDRAIAVLKRLLVPQGLLFVGPAEAALMVNHNLVSAKRPMAFAFRNAPPAAPREAEKRTVRLKKRPPVISTSVPKSPAPSRMRTQRLSMGGRSAVLSGKIKIDLKMASRLADEGRLAEAAKVCEAYLKEHKTSVEGLYLLGVICDAAGDGEKAGACYRKVLYLEPEHYESLLHLSYLAEKGGDASASQNLRARAQRVKERRQHA